MLRRRNDDQLVTMDGHDREPGVGYGERDHAEVHGVVDDRFKRLGIVGAFDPHSHFGVGPLEVREDLGKDVQAGAFVGAYNQFSAGDALGFGDGDANGFACFDGFLGVLEEELAGLGERDFAARTVKQAGTNVFLQRADLGGNGGLGAKTLLGGARERTEPRNFQESF
jgi:hypothetical protein